MPTNTTGGHALTVPADSDEVNDGADAIRVMANQIDRLLPYHGSASGTTDSNGQVVITHGLGFTPSAVFVESSSNSPTAAFLATSVDSIGATTFRIRFVKLVLQAGSNYYVNPSAVTAAYTCKWMAFR